MTRRLRRLAWGALGVFGATCDEPAAGARASTRAPRPAVAVPGPVAGCVDVNDERRTCTGPVTGGWLRFVDSVGRSIQLAVQLPGEPWRPLPPAYGHELWSMCTLPTEITGVPRADRVAITDVDGDGRADVVVAGECATGVGPEGARSFPVATIYTQRVPGHFTTDVARDSLLTDTSSDACWDEARDPVCGATALAARARPLYRR